MSEYGISSPEEITWHWTPAQALVMAECIRRRRALRRAEETEFAYVAMAAAQGGKKAFSTLRSSLKRLHKEAGLTRPSDPEALAHSLGLTDRRSEKKQ
jgi:hypothetical protein